MILSIFGIGFAEMIVLLFALTGLIIFVVGRSSKNKKPAIPGFVVFIVPVLFILLSFFRQ